MNAKQLKAAVLAIGTLAAVATPLRAVAERNDALPGPRLDLGRMITRATVAPPPYALRMPIPPPPLEESAAVRDARRAGGLSLTDRSTSNPGYRLYRPTVVPLSRTESSIKGLGAGTTMGWVLGALGTTAGVWDRDTWAYMAATGAAAGALLGGTTLYESDNGWSTRIDWGVGGRDREEPR